MKDYCVLSRTRGAAKWYRHIPGAPREETALANAERYALANPDREYTVRAYDRAPAPTYPNGQVRGARRRRRRA
jgi:hypothetical protein